MSRIRHHAPAGILALGFLLAACAGEDPASSVEIPRPDEAAKSAQAVRNFEKLLENYKTEYVNRGAHAKAHACVRADFTVMDDIDGRYRHGIFSQPGRRYKSWIRFSNGHFDRSVSRDQKPDARGMAVKLLQPPGEPLQIAANGVPTQDFLMTNSPVFFIKTIEDYNALVAAPEDLGGFVFHSINPLKWRLHELLLARKTLTAPPQSLLSEQYFSITAYKLGPHNIKFSARPCRDRQQGSTPVEALESEDPDFLAKDLARQLQAGTACFEFLVQEQVPEQGMSIEDPTVEWPEALAPFTALARISIPAQVFAEPQQQAFCEDLAFAPWHALPAHRPLGQFNRMRRAVYPASSNYRHEANKTTVPADLIW